MPHEARRIRRCRMPASGRTHLRRRVRVAAGGLTGTNHDGAVPCCAATWPAIVTGRPSSGPAVISQSQFDAFAAAGCTRIPLVREVLSDLDTPLSVYLK